jgi:MEDS: MEthanogen/methylotroph, DcmR Sensory domain
MPIFECPRCNEMTYSASGGAVAPCPSCGSERHRVIEGDFDEARRGLRTLGEADHAMLVYDQASAIAPFCARFLTDGVNAGERVVAGVQDDLREAICAVLSPDVELAVEWDDPQSLYGDFDPDRVAATYEALVSGEEGPTRILAGLDGESAKTVDRAELERYETLAHGIVTDHGATVVCLYDAGALPPGFLAVSASCHGLTIEDGAVRRNERFEYQPA